MSDAAPQMVLALSGGVGGAKLSLGLSQVLPPERLHILVNTGDDFQHMGLHISPDIDTHIYTLSGRSNRAQGWGLEGETWQTMAALEELGGETWFRLGDGDLLLARVDDKHDRRQGAHALEPAEELLEPLALDLQQVLLLLLLFLRGRPWFQLDVARPMQCDQHPR